jgi:hypothetical protein
MRSSFKLASVEAHTKRLMLSKALKSNPLLIVNLCIRVKVKGKITVFKQADIIPASTPKVSR